MELFERVKGLCETSGISIPQLEKLLNFGNRAIYKWKDQSPSIEKVAKVADYFGVSIDYLLNRSVTTHAVQPMHIELVRKVDELNPDGIKALDDYLDFILSKPEYLKKNRFNTEMEA